MHHAWRGRPTPSCSGQHYILSLGHAAPLAVEELVKLAHIRSTALGAVKHGPLSSLGLPLLCLAPLLHEDSHEDHELEYKDLSTRTRADRHKTVRHARLREVRHNKGWRWTPDRDPQRAAILLAIGHVLERGQLGESEGVEDNGDGHKDDVEEHERL